jgi:hypothetical protein
MGRCGQGGQFVEEHQSLFLTVRAPVLKEV